MSHSPAAELAAHNLTNQPVLSRAAVNLGLRPSIIGKALADQKLPMLLLLWITAHGITSRKTIARMVHGINRERLDFETPYLLLLRLTGRVVHRWHWRVFLSQHTARINQRQIRVR